MTDSRDDGSAQQTTACTESNTNSSSSEVQNDHIAGTKRDGHAAEDAVNVLCPAPAAAAAAPVAAGDDDDDGDHKLMMNTSSCAAGSSTHGAISQLGNLSAVPLSSSSPTRPPPHVPGRLRASLDARSPLRVSLDVPPLVEVVRSRCATLRDDDRDGSDGELEARLLRKYGLV